jgi:hypothetical protein
MRGKRQPMAPRTLQGVCIDQGFEAGIRQERHEIEGLASIWPSNTEAATRPNKAHHNSVEFPFLYLALAIYAENDRNEGCTMFKGREKVPVLVVM